MPGRFPPVQLSAMLGFPTGCNKTSFCTRCSMSLQVLASRPYTLLPSGILIVEPHEGLLAARSMLLAAAEHYVGIPSASSDEVEKGKGGEVAIAILSESLGYGALCETARVVRRNWPRARILIYGCDRAAIEDSLYDARIDQGSRPEALLAALLMLTEYPSNQTLKPVVSLVDGRVGRLLHSGGAWGTVESDPTKCLPTKVQATDPRDRPTEEQLSRRAFQS